MRDSEITLLETGDLGGGSLRTWRVYFSSVRIRRGDIDPDAAQHEGTGSACTSAARATPPSWTRSSPRPGPLDVVIDDGSHLARDQVGSLLHLWLQVKPGGVYVVEDTHTSYFPAYEMGWRQPGMTMEFLKDVADDVRAAGHDARSSSATASTSPSTETCLLRKLS